MVWTSVGDVTIKESMFSWTHRRRKRRQGAWDVAPPALMLTQKNPFFQLRNSMDEWGFGSTFYTPFFAQKPIFQKRGVTKEKISNHCGRIPP